MDLAAEAAVVVACFLAVLAVLLVEELLEAALIGIIH